MIDERIDRMFDRNVVFQRADVFDEHIRIERLRVVVIEFRALFVRQFGMGFVVVVVAERDYLFLLESLLQSFYQRAFTRSCAACDTDDCHIHNSRFVVLFYFPFSACDNLLTGFSPKTV